MSKLYDENIFEFTGESVDGGSYVIGTYYLEDTVPGENFIDHLQLVKSVALEGSTGTWMRIKDDTPEVRKKLTGKCIGYYEIPSDDPYTKKAIVQLALPIDAWEGSSPMLMLAVAGNCFAVSNKSRVLDVQFPKEIVESYPGPKFGVEGMRKMFNEPERPLCLHIIKPKMGMTPEQTANQVYDTAIGGADLAKDDEMCSDVYNCSTIDRVKAVAEAVDRSQQKTGKKLCYLASVTDEVDNIKDKAKRAIEAGAHAYAARDGRYTSLSTWGKDPDGNLVGTLEMPLAVGIVGGATGVNPASRAALKLMDVKTARELAEIIVSVGLAQNLAALRALATEGIQRGHMELHARQVAVTAGAQGEEIERLTRQLLAEKNINVIRAEEILKEWKET